MDPHTFYVAIRIWIPIGLHADQDPDEDPHLVKIDLNVFLYKVYLKNSLKRVLFYKRNQHDFYYQFIDKFQPKTKKKASTLTFSKFHHFFTV